MWTNFFHFISTGVNPLTFSCMLAGVFLSVLAYRRDKKRNALADQIRIATERDTSQDKKDKNVKRIRFEMHSYTRLRNDISNIKIVDGDFDGLLFIKDFYERMERDRASLEAADSLEDL